MSALTSIHSSCNNGLFLDLNHAVKKREQYTPTGYSLQTQLFRNVQHIIVCSSLRVNVLREEVEYAIWFIVSNQIRQPVSATCLLFEII